MQIKIIITQRAQLIVAKRIPIVHGAMGCDKNKALS